MLNNESRLLMFFCCLLILVRVFDLSDLYPRKARAMIHFLRSGIRSVDSVARSRKEHESDGQHRVLMLNPLKPNDL
jgi:hypothetical protein